jgi:predicted nucleic acid-binding protein
VAMKYLIDTNIFLEILLKQDKASTCKSFLNAHFDNICISDFSLHSIGVILFRQNKDSIFQKFVNDIIPKVQIIALPKEAYGHLIKRKKMSKLDFDDAYQFEIALNHNLEIVTMDKDFERIKDEGTVTFL